MERVGGRTMPNFSFPYAQLGSIRRPAGQGCKNCVHVLHCMNIFWFRRYGITLAEFDDHMGTACTSWSNNPADKVLKPTTDDLNENEYQYNQGIQSEPDRNGLTAPVSGSSDYRG
jgi:hypothetical protein